MSGSPKCLGSGSNALNTEQTTCLVKKEICWNWMQTQKHQTYTQPLNSRKSLRSLSKSWSVPCFSSISRIVDMRDLQWTLKQIARLELTSYSIYLILPIHVANCNSWKVYRWLVNQVSAGQNWIATVQIWMVW